MAVEHFTGYILKVLDIDLLNQQTTPVAVKTTIKNKKLG